MRDPTFWILARSGGLTAYLALTAAMLVGLVVKSRPFGRAVKPAAATDTHRFLTLIALGATALHGAALTLDSTVPIPLQALVIPGLSPYSPGATALGVIAAEIATLVVISFPLRKRIGTRLWRRLHWTSYGIFAAATAHGLAAGSDSAQPWVFGIYAGAVAAVVFATTWRVLVSPVRRARQVA